LIRPGEIVVSLPDKTMPPNAISIRTAVQADSSAIALLMAELGYPANKEEVDRRLEQTSTSPADLVLVAETGQQMTAMASIHFMLYFHRGETLCKITSFVVKDGYRGQGIGSALLAHIERFARERGCHRMELTSAEGRTEAHAFYEGKGYRKAGFKFYKPLE